MVAATQQMEEKISNTAMGMAHRYVSAYRDTLLTDSQIVAAMTSDALVSPRRTLTKLPRLLSSTSNIITTP
jgi:hypothetical protein